MLSYFDMETRITLVNKRFFKNQYKDIILIKTMSTPITVWEIRLL